MINVAIVEDESEAAEILTQHLKRYAEEKGTQFHTVWFNNPVLFLERYKASYDIILMDIEMPHINGMDAAKKLRDMDKSVALIFVTNMAQFAIKGYEVDAFDFIVKPLSYFNFALKLERVVERIKTREEIKLAVTVDDATRFIRAVDIYYIEVIKHSVIYHTVNGTFESYGTLKKIEPILGGAGFAKCNNCYLVNLRYVSGVKGFTVTVGKEELQISHPKKKEFLRALNIYLGEKV